MKIATIKNLVANESLQSLEKAEFALINNGMLEIAVEGDDEGEQLTHLMAAIEIKQNIATGMPEKDALRAFTLRVRNSIS